MGMHIVGSANRAAERVGCNCNCSKEPLKDTTAPALDPRADNFRIVDTNEIGNYLIAVLNYPNCTPYSGYKILVYKGVSTAEIMKWGLVDPHFLENENFISPIARFPSDMTGVNWALDFVNMLNEEDERVALKVESLKKRGWIKEH